MIEIKLSQGAKPGHGGVLPARRRAPTRRRAAHLEGKGLRIASLHSAFSTPIEMVELAAKLRDLSGGKPVGIALRASRTKSMPS